MTFEIVTVAATFLMSVQPGIPSSRHACIEAAHTAHYVILSDRKIQFNLDDNRTAIMHLDKACPQLLFQKYFSVVPLDGQVCAGRDHITARTGEICTIKAIEFRQ